MAFESVEDAEAWAEANGGEDGLRASIGAGVFGNNLKTIAFATEWLRQQEQVRAEAAVTHERALRLREVAAAEAAAIAARDSADAASASAEAAVRSIRWAKIAAAVAGASAFISLAQAFGWVTKT